MAFDYKRHMQATSSTALPITINGFTYNFPVATAASVTAAASTPSATPQAAMLYGFANVSPMQGLSAHIPLINAPKEYIEVGCPPLRKLFAQIEASTNWQDVNFAGSWNPQDKASALYEKLLFMRGYDPNQFYIAYTNDHSVRSKKVSRPAACTAS